MVSLKYEVDESYLRVDDNDKLTTIQKQEEINKLDIKGSQLKVHAYSLSLFAFVTFVAATGLIIKRNKILGEKKSSP